MSDRVFRCIYCAGIVEASHDISKDFENLCDSKDKYCIYEELVPLQRVIKSGFKPPFPEEEDASLDDPTSISGNENVIEQ